MTEQGLVGFRLSSSDYFQGNPPTRDGISSKPDGTKAAETKLVKNSVSTPLKLIAEKDGMETSQLVVLEVFAFLQLARKVFEWGIGVRVRDRAG